ncbi:MAG TPA: tRNA lysidine(34) synthetase TilS, partial [Luteolibacter sp.]|nr:tRNA lysidine(34) synthetase TilS [Luteolibacter sp.]
MDIPWLKSASKRQRYLVGVSGGADSVALLHLLVEAGFRDLVVCHLDHGLRGRVSTADARFVEQMAARLNLPCEVAKAEVKALMKERGFSLETAARQARHAWFAACASKRRCKRLFLAHHAEDQAETILWNLLRGSHGLKGMSQEQELRVGAVELQLIRPLLTVHKTELMAYLTERGLDWREDASNAQPIAVRNRLRHEIFPLLAQISGRDAVAAFAQAAADWAEWDALEAALAEQAAATDPQGRLHLPSLRKQPPLIQRALIKDHLLRHGIASLDRSLLERALTLLDPEGPAVINLPGGARLRRRAGRV